MPVSGRRPVRVAPPGPPPLANRIERLLFFPASSSVARFGGRGLRRRTLLRPAAAAAARSPSPSVAPSRSGSCGLRPPGSASPEQGGGLPPQTAADRPLTLDAVVSVSGPSRPGADEHLHVGDPHKETVWAGCEETPGWHGGCGSPDHAWAGPRLDLTAIPGNSGYAASNNRRKVSSAGRFTCLHDWTRDGFGVAPGGDRPKSARVRRFFT